MLLPPRAGHRVTHDDGQLIKSQLAAGVNVTMRLDPAFRAGADPAGRVKLYTPIPFALGSSVSHWDTSPTPNLLMEPALNADVTGRVDLTPWHYVDIGWVTQGPASAGEISRPPKRLLGNFPNPFQSSTSIRFALEREQPVMLGVYDLAGRLVKRLVDGPLPAGDHTLRWEGTDQSGRPAAAGIYQYSLRASGRIESGRMVLVR